jgi:hypothetical protein
MKKLLTAAAALTLGAAAPMFAQYTTPSSNPNPPQDQSTVPDQTSPAYRAAPSTPDMTGQELYNSDGDHIGTITAMTMSSDGQRLTVVDMGRHLGMGADKLPFPINALQPRDKGGYMTTLGDDQIKQLPRANATNTQQ